MCSFKYHIQKSFRHVVFAFRDVKIKQIPFDSKKSYTIFFMHCVIYIYCYFNIISS